MSLLPRLLVRFWFIAPLTAVGFLFWIHSARVQRVELVSGLPNTTVAVDPGSATGYAGGVRMLIAPGHNNESYQWIAQTQQMIAEGKWRLRHVAYDNAPTGRVVLTPSPYRWWLAAIGWCNHVITGQPIGLAVEEAALWSDPVLHLLFLGAAVVFTWLRFGRLPALLLSLAIATLFPLAGGFVPGSPDARTLTHLTLFASVMTLIAGVLAAETSTTAARRWFIASGVIGGGALWLNVAVVPVLAAIGVGGLGAGWLNRNGTRVALPWRAWAVAGAVATSIAYFLEYAPGHLDLTAFRLTAVHPLYALAWLGGGELLARLQSSKRGAKKRRREHAIRAVALLAFLSVPAAMGLKNDPGFLQPGIFANRLTLLDEAVGAENFAKWMVQNGLTAQLLATGLSLVLVGVAIWLLCRRDTGALRRTALAILLVPTLMALAFSFAELSWWNTFDFLLLAVLVVAASGASAADRHASRWLAGAAVAMIPGLIALLPAKSSVEKIVLSRVELQSLAERDFAQWLARRQGPEGAIVFAPPNMTVSLFYHGGLRGLGSPFRENEEGFRASVRLAGAIHADESQALVRQRGVTHIVMPSWDDFLDEYARLGGSELERTFVGTLRAWLPPRWLRPVPYYLPAGDEFANDQVFVFEHTDIQENSTSLSRLGEYFIDMGQIDFATQVAQALAHEYAADLGAQVAKARTDIVRRDRPAFSKTLETITAALQQGADDALLWDRRVSLCLVLAAGGRMTPAKEQAERCVDEMSELEVRTLSEPTLFGFLRLCKSLGVEIEDPSLRDYARSLVPAAVRDQL